MTLKTDLKNPKYKYIKEIQRILTDDNNEVLMEYLEMELENWKLKDWVNKYCLYYSPTEEERQKLQNVIEIYSKMRNERGKEKSKEKRVNLL